MLPSLHKMRLQRLDQVAASATKYFSLSHVLHGPTKLRELVLPGRVPTALLRVSRLISHDAQRTCGLEVEGAGDNCRTFGRRDGGRYEQSAQPFGWSGYE